MTKEMTKPRAEFLRGAKEPKGISAVDYYPPAKWALEKGYVTVTVGRFGGSTYRITPDGEAAILRAGDHP